MKNCATCKVEQPPAAFAKRSRNRDGLQDSCRECCRSYAAQWRAKNLDRKRQMDREYAAANRQRAIDKTREWVAKNPDRKKETDRAYAKANVSRIQKTSQAYRRANQINLAAKKRQDRLDRPEYYREKGREWRQNNKAVVLADRALRKARKRQATPNWLTFDHKNRMKAAYEMAVLFTETFGEPFHVDHIVPIGGKTVCGLHVPWNLQVLQARDNLVKGNRF